MMAPWSEGAGVATAVPVGVAFGWALERAGLGSVRTIGDQLRGRDFTVIKVMFSAIMTAMLGLFWAGRLGYLDTSRLAMPATDLAPQALGAVIFGAGFAVAALCPGTACVAAGTGRREGFAVLGGLVVGTAAALAARPSLATWFERTPRLDATLPGDLGVPVGVVIAGIVVLALGAIALGDRIEGTAAPRRPGALTAMALTLGVGALLSGEGTALPAASLTAIAGEVAAERDHVDPLELAEWIRDSRPGLRVIAVDERVDPASDLIPGTKVVPLSRIAGLTTVPGETVVLYSAGGAHAAQAWVLLRTRGVRDVYVLRDGLAAWEDEVMAPRAPVSARVRELTRWFGGRPRPPGETDPGAAVARRRRNTC